MPAKLKLTYDLIDQIVELKRDGLCDADIIAALGVHPSTFYRWIKDGEEAKSGVKRALYEELKKRNRNISARCSRPSRGRPSRGLSSGPLPLGCLSASTRWSTAAWIAKTRRKALGLSSSRLVL